MPRRQHGFTLVEIAIVLVVIGLLLGGILKGQELVNGARVRNLADMNAGIQAAYYGLRGPLPQVPATWRPLPPPRPSATPPSPRAATERADRRRQLARGIRAVGTPDPGPACSRAATTAEPGARGGTRAAAMAPQNAFNGYVVLGQTRDYSTPGGAPTATQAVRLGLVLGDNIPVDIARELDLKIDDQRPLTGALRFTGTTTFSHRGVSEATTLCMASATTNEYDVAGDAQQCNLVYIY